MSGLQVLIVDDDDEFCADIKELLEGSKKQLVGSRLPLSVQEAANQVDAERTVEMAPPGGFDLILLDRKYPRKEGKSPDFLGEDWLPRLRKSQPHAAIAVFTSYGDGAGGSVEVKMLRDDDAGGDAGANRRDSRSVEAEMLRNDDVDEFILKMIPWKNMLERLQSALRNRSRRIRGGLQTQPFESTVAKTSAQDLSVALRARKPITVSI